jgi:hypothetical protein
MQTLTIPKVHSVTTLVNGFVVEFKLAAHSFLDHFTERDFLEVLVVGPYVVDVLLGYLVALLAHDYDCTGAVINVKEWAPSIWAIDLDLVVVPTISDELMHKQIKPHTASKPVNGRKPAF